jgi:hypothetical protein
MTPNSGARLLARALSLFTAVTAGAVIVFTPGDGLNTIVDGLLLAGIVAFIWVRAPTPLEKILRSIPVSKP